jgi:hypothetical protein
MAALGMDAAAIDRELAKLPIAVAAPVELEEADEGRAVALFFALDTQWNWTNTGMINGNGGTAVRTGLRYGSIAPAAAALGIAVDARVFLDLRVLEAEALKTMAEAKG